MKNKFFIPVLISLIMIISFSCKNESTNVVSPTKPTKFKTVIISAGHILVTFTYSSSSNSTYDEDSYWGFSDSLKLDSAGSSINDNVLKYSIFKKHDGYNVWDKDSCLIKFNQVNNIIDSLIIILSFCNEPLPDYYASSSYYGDYGILLFNVPYSYNSNNEIEVNISGNDLIGKIKPDNLYVSQYTAGRHQGSSSNECYYKSIKSISDSSFVKLKIIPIN